jgi:hypothetical protein
METFLIRLNEYQVEDKAAQKDGSTNTKKNIGKLRSLSGMRVIVGKYLGLDDQGRCILPWDWSL